MNILDIARLALGLGAGGAVGALAALVGSADALRTAIAGTQRRVEAYRAQPDAESWAALRADAEALGAAVAQIERDFGHARRVLRIR